MIKTIGKKLVVLAFFIALFLLVGCGKTYNVTINYNKGGDDDTETLTVKSASEIEVKAVSKEGYEFGGWYIDSSFVTKFSADMELKEDLTLYAKWNPLSYTVKFLVNGNEITSQNVFYGSDAIAPDDPSIEGHTFKGWDKAFTNVKSNLEVNALFEKETYTVKFMDGAKELASQSVKYGEAATAPENVVKAGYTFKKWDKDFSNVKSHLIVNAEFEANTINITYYDEETALNLAPASFTYGEAPELPSYNKEGYIFIGWFSDANCIDEVTSLSDITEDTTLYALTVTVKYFDGDTQITNLASVKVEDDLVIVPDYKVEGYVFIGWFLDKAFTQPFDKELQLLEDTDLYALLLKVDYNGGSNSWTVGSWSSEHTVTNGLKPISSLADEWEKDFFKYLSDENLLSSTLLGEGLAAPTWAEFSAVNKLHNGDPQRVWNDTVLTKADSTSCGYSALFLYDEIDLNDDNSLKDVRGGFLGTEPYKTKYFNVLNQLIVLYLSKYNVDVTTGTPTSRQLFAYVIDGYFYGTQSVTSSSKPEFTAFRTNIPTTTTYYVWNGTSAVEKTREYTVTTDDSSIYAKIAVPFKEGAKFAGWFTDSGLTQSLEGATITSRMTVYAKWE